MKFSENSQKHGFNQGFSLIEVQIAVAVIAVITAIAVPQVCRINDRAQAAKDKANAQHVSAVAAAATAAGVVFRDLDSAVAQLTGAEGAVISEGIFAGGRYRLTSLSSTEVEGAKRHLRFANGQLTVVP
jgi:prepilin-type N-terminal cleavage/methylation domain-containing protein